MSRQYYQIANLKPHLKNPSKCVSSVVTCRSGWEIKFVLKYLDINTNIIKWSSEDVVIQYFCPTDGKNHRYFVDFWFEAKTKSGKIKEFLIEIKPYSQSIPPKEPKRKSKNFLNEVQTYIKNTAKWETVKNYCKTQRELGKDIEFLVITEKDVPYFNQ